ncbi:MAG: hypothetical protein WCR30_04670 [Clostridia bacterium]
MFLKKTVVLSGKGQNKEKAVLTLEKSEDEYKGTVKLYNFSSNPEGILTLGFLPENGKVTKCGLTPKGSMLYNFNILENISLNSFSCALIQIEKGKAVPILVGSYNESMTQTVENRLAFSSELLQEKSNIRNVETALDENEIYLENQEEIDKEIDEEIKKTDVCFSCTNCPYRKAFYDAENNKVASPCEKKPVAIKFEDKSFNSEIKKNEQSKMLTTENLTGKSKENSLNNTLNNALKFEVPKEEKDFYQQIQEELEELFETYPREELLEKIVPFSKWVRVGLDNEDEHYVVGTINENDKLKYVCYGIPGIYSGKPPKQIEKFAQWLPVDVAKPNEFGYWMTYQEASSGESIRIII